MGRDCRIRGRLSGTRRVAPLAALRNRTKDRKAPRTTTPFPLWRGLIVGRSGSFDRDRLLIPISGVSSLLTASELAIGKLHRPQRPPKLG